MDVNTAIDNLEEDLDTLTGVKTVKMAQSATGGLIKAAKILSSVSPEESVKLVELLGKIYALSLDNITGVITIASDAMKIVKSIQQKIETEANSPFLEFSGIRKEATYVKACSTYSSYKRQIEQTEKKIQQTPLYNKKLHEELKQGDYAGCLHARVTRNLRIIYYIEKSTKVLVYAALIAHDEM